MSIDNVSKAAATLVTQMFKSDADKSGSLSAAEYKNYVTSKPGNASASTDAAFKQMDADGNGELTETEASAFFSPPQLSTPSLDSATTSSLLSMLSEENTASANSSATLMQQLLQQYTGASGSNGKFSTDA